MTVEPNEPSRSTKTIKVASTVQHIVLKSKNQAETVAQPKGVETEPASWSNLLGGKVEANRAVAALNWQRYASYRPVTSTSSSRAWQTAVVKGSGHTPTWTKNKALIPDSLAAFHKAGLRFHDLRHEAGSRLLEAGWPVHHVQHMLGHANLSQTSTYLNATRIGLRDSMRRLDGAREMAENSGVYAPPLQAESPIDQRPSLQREDSEES